MAFRLHLVDGDARPLRSLIMTGKDGAGIGHSYHFLPQTVEYPEYNAQIQSSKQDDDSDLTSNARNA